MKISALPVFVSLFLIGASQIDWTPSISSEKQPCKPIISHEALGIQFQVRGRYHKAITQKELRRANSLSDIIEHFPANWIDEYNEVVIESTQENQPILASGKNERLNAQQKSILKRADLESYLCVDVHYNAANSVTNKLEPRVMHKVIRVIPDQEASYKAGNEALIQYIKDGCNTLNFKTIDGNFPLPYCPFFHQRNGSSRTH